MVHSDRVWFVSRLALIVSVALCSLFCRRDRLENHGTGITLRSRYPSESTKIAVTIQN